MEGTSRWLAVAAIAPVAWGSTYFVTHEFLPDAPLWGAAIRALPAGLLLTALVRRVPGGSWWWKTPLLGTLNVGAFFVLVYVAAQRLPTSIASTVTAVSPVVIALVAWLIVRERPSAPRLGGAALGIVGVALMVLSGRTPVDGLGITVSVAAMVMSSFGFLLGKRWNDEVGLLASTAWQLTAGGLILLPIAALAQGAPPQVGARGVAAYAFLTLVATALAYLTWFAALSRLRADVVGLIGLLNPVSGVVLGVLFAGDTLGVRQLVGLVLVLVGIAGPLRGRQAVAPVAGSPLTPPEGLCASTSAGLPLSRARRRA
jgi:probable blue pigment (indigoidine) exporter